MVGVEPLWDVSRQCLIAGGAGSNEAVMPISDRTTTRGEPVLFLMEDVSYSVYA